MKVNKIVILVIKCPISTINKKSHSDLLIQKNLTQLKIKDVHKEKEIQNDKN